MRIASYNLFEGAQDTYPLLKEFVEQESIDILCLQEANGWDEGEPSRFDDFAGSTALKHSAFGDTNTRFKLATFSRHPFVDARLYTAGFWHGVLRTSVEYEGQNLAISNVHLDPRGESERLAEVRSITRLQYDGLVRGEKITCGDLNSLSRVDDYPDSLARRLGAKGITKFGDGELRYDATETFRLAGYEDAANALDKRDHTVPTPANTDEQHAERLRLDYFFVYSSLLSAVKGFDTPKNELTDRISDHYPIVLTL